MTARDDLDRLLTAWFAGDAPAREPGHLLGQVLARTARTPRRRWPFVSRFDVMQATMRVPTAPRLIFMLPFALLLAILAIALIAVGSQRRLPPPFGLARPGLIAYEADGDIILAGIDGSSKTTLAGGPVYGFGPSWSHDGTRLAYWSGAGWDKPVSLVVVDAGGGSPSVIASDIVGPSHRISWSPDGRWVVFSAQVEAIDRLMVADVRRGGAVLLGDASVRGTDPAWSPDGRTIAFRAGQTYRDVGVYAVGADGTGLRRLTGVLDSTIVTDLEWSPDGTRILFTTGDEWDHDILEAAADGSGDHAVANTRDDESGPVWSPDGSRIAYQWHVLGVNRAPGTNHAMVVDADGSHRRELAGFDGPGIWSPDGGSLVVWENVGGVRWMPKLVDPGGRVVGQLLDADPVSWQRLAP